MDLPPSTSVDALFGSASSQSNTDIQTLCDSLKSELCNIASDEQKGLPKPGNVNQSDVEGAIYKLVDTLKVSNRPKKFESAASQVEKVLKYLFPIIDSAVQLGGSFGTTAWGSFKLIL